MKEKVYFKDYQTLKDIASNLPKFIDEIYTENVPILMNFF